MPHVNAGDTAWLLASAALVMFMTPGLAFFYGGLVRAKNVVGTVMQSFIALAVVTITWALIGYSLAFGPDKGGIIGGLDFFALNHVGGIPNAFAPTVPATTFMAFQMMFAIITPALIAGAFAERMKFSGYLMFVALWSIVCTHRSRTGSGVAGSWAPLALGRWTSPAARWSTRTPVPRRLLPPSTLAVVGATGWTTCHPATCRS